MRDDNTGLRCRGALRPDTKLDDAPSCREPAAPCDGAAAIAGTGEAGTAASCGCSDGSRCGSPAKFAYGLCARVSISFSSLASAISHTDSSRLPSAAGELHAPQLTAPAAIPDCGVVSCACLRLRPGEQQRKVRADVNFVTGGRKRAVRRRDDVSCEAQQDRSSYSYQQLKC